MERACKATTNTSLIYRGTDYWLRNFITNIVNSVDHFEKLIKVIHDENKEMYILGDLNCDMLKTDKDSNFPTKKIKTLYELYQLSQLIDEATRVTMTTSSLIDHIVTNTPEKISDSGVIHTGLSDHIVLYLQ